jgi:hypothetical protein
MQLENPNSCCSQSAWQGSSFLHALYTWSCYCHACMHSHQLHLFWHMRMRIWMDRYIIHACVHSGAVALQDMLASWSSRHRFARMHAYTDTSCMHASVYSTWHLFGFETYLWRFISLEFSNHFLIAFAARIWFILCTHTYTRACWRVTLHEICSGMCMQM